MTAAPLDGRQRPASLAPIVAALCVLAALGVLALVAASWPSGGTHAAPDRAPSPGAMGGHPAGTGTGSPSPPAIPRRGSVWAQARPHGLALLP